MMELTGYQIINTELKNDLIISMFYGNLTDVRKRRANEEIYKNIAMYYGFAY